MTKHLLALSVAALLAVPAQAALTAGDIAIVGRTNNGTPDSFAVLALTNIAAGEVIYFTDNGWTGTGFRSPNATDGDGNENLTKWLVSSNVAAGTIIQSTSTDFTISGSIPGTSSGVYASLALGQSGDQIYAFQSNSVDHPLANVSSHLFVLDDTNGFEVGTTSSTGALPAGGVGVSVNSAVGGSFAVKSSVLSGAAKSQSEWLGTLTNAANWEAVTALPTDAVAVSAVPEPETYALLLAGLGVIGSLSRRRRG